MTFGHNHRAAKLPTFYPKHTNIFFPKISESLGQIYAKKKVLNCKICIKLATRVICQQMYVEMVRKRRVRMKKNQKDREKDFGRFQDVEFSVNL